MSSTTIRPDAGRVCVIDDDLDINESITLTLESAGYHVYGFTRPSDFLSQTAPTEPTALLVDLLLPGMTGLDLCREVIARGMPCEFAIISGHADVPSTVDAMRLGAIDLLEKPFSRQRLLTTVDRALQAAVSKHKRRLADEEVTRQLSILSAREREIFDAIAAGLVTKEIATRFGISARTVDVHRSRIKQKLGIESPLQLANLLALVALKATGALGHDAHPMPRPHLLSSMLVKGSQQSGS